MPKNVRRFAWLWWSSNLLEFCGIPFAPPLDPSKTVFTRASQMEFDFIAIAVVIALLLPFYWLAVSRRKNWARWVLALFFAALAVANLFVSTPPIHNPVGVAIDYVSWLALAAAFFFLFTGDARPWFNRKLPQLDADVFL